MKTTKAPRLEKGSIPLYVQLEQILKSKIITGELLPGQRIPTEKELAEIYRVSSITARQAVLNLVQEGLLLRQQGKGTFVQDGTTNVKNIMTLNVRGDISEVIPEGLSAQKVEVLEMGRVSSPRRVASALNLQDDEVFRIRRTRSDKGIVVSYIKNYLPLEVGEKIKREDLLDHPMLHILRETLALPVETGVQYITAVVADYEIASALAVSISAPVLYLETIISMEGERPVDFVQTFYRSDQFKYTLKINLDGIKMF
jgi:GntR family transcriptional regulator